MKWHSQFLFDSCSRKYKFMEQVFAQKKLGLESKIPEIKKTLETVLFLKSQETSDAPIACDYELSDTLWAQAKLQNVKSVNLWLGANVMVEYSLSEAEKLLKEKLQKANLSLTQLIEDLEYLRDQYTTMEVNIARVHNADVQMRRTKNK